jgi:hypothetical protein
MGSLNQLWKSMGKPGSFKEFTAAYNSGAFRNFNALPEANNPIPVLENPSAPTNPVISPAAPSGSIKTDPVVQTLTPTSNSDNSIKTFGGGGGSNDKTAGNNDCLKTYLFWAGAGMCAGAIAVLIFKKIKGN